MLEHSRRIVGGRASAEESLSILARLHLFPSCRLRISPDRSVSAALQSRQHAGLSRTVVTSACRREPSKHGACRLDISIPGPFMREAILIFTLGTK